MEISFRRGKHRSKERVEKVNIESSESIRMNDRTYLISIIEKLPSRIIDGVSIEIDYE